MRRWEQSWTATEFLRTLVPSERTWWLAGLSSYDGHLQVAALTADGAAPVGSLSWLLHSVGGVDCGPSLQPPLPELRVEVPTTLDADDPDGSLALLVREAGGSVNDPVRFVATSYGIRVQWSVTLDGPIALGKRELPTGWPRSVDAQGREILSNGWNVVIAPK